MKKMPLFPIYSLSPATAISPIDGRYNNKTKELSRFFSEIALMRFRLLVEVEWLIFLSVVVKVIRRMTRWEKIFLRGLYQNFSEENFYDIKAAEKETNHDVKAVELYLKSVLLKNRILVDLVGFIHIGLTSEDINNTAFGFMLRGGVNLLLGQYFKAMKSIEEIIKKDGNTPLLAHTHGQPASPTTIGWEMKVYFERLDALTDELGRSKIRIKFGGASGGHNALYAAWPKIDWRKYSERFVARLNQIERGEGSLIDFIFNPFTTQIENHDTYAKLFGIIERINTTLIGFNRDMWTYISMRVFIQKPKEGEAGSSTMPHKVNPIDFENSEGNLGVANALFQHFIEKLPISRLQRDLTDSTVIRNFGPAFGHSLLAAKSLTVGLGKVSVNKPEIEAMLSRNWAVLAEPIQIILRREGISEGYDLLKKLTRGHSEIDRDQLHNFIESVVKEHKLSAAVEAELKALSPHEYIGNRSLN